MIHSNSSLKSFKKKKKNFPKSLIPFLFLSQFLFGIDFGFTDLLKIQYRKLAKCFAFVKIVFLLLISLFPISTYYYQPWPYLYSSEYLLTVLILKTLKYHLCDFITEIQTKKNEVGKFCVAVTVVTYGLIFLKFAVQLKICHLDRRYCPGLNPPFLYFYMWFYLSIDVVAAGQMFAFYYVSLELKNTKVTIRKSEVSLREFLKQFMKIVDSYDRIRPMLERLVLLAVFIGIPKLMISLWYTILSVKADTWARYLGQFIFTFHHIIQICLPSVFAEGINTQMDVIKLKLSELIATDTDESRAVLATKVLQYVDKRSLRHRIFNVVPLDIHLPIGIFSLCSTYFIVLLQFTHLLD